MVRYIIGIDPGFTGGIAVLDLDTHSVTAVDMPVYKGKSGKTLVNAHELVNLLEPPEGNPKQVMAVLEQVWARQGEGISSAFRFGQGYGALQAVLAAHKLPTHDVTPPKWKKHFGLSKEKDASRGLIIQRYPSDAHQFKFKKDHGKAEAALIALYGKEKLL